MLAFLATGKGKFKDENGNEVVYPINKLVLQNEAGDTVSFKTDKISRILLPYLFDIEETDTLIEDDAGNTLSISYLHEKSTQSKKIVVE